MVGATSKHGIPLPLRCGHARRRPTSLPPTGRQWRDQPLRLQRHPRRVRRWHPGAHPGRGVGPGGLCARRGAGRWTGTGADALAQPGPRRACTFDGRGCSCRCRSPRCTTPATGRCAGPAGTRFSVGEADAVLGYRLMAQSGYPWTLDLHDGLLPHRRGPHRDGAGYATSPPHRRRSPPVPIPTSPSVRLRVHPARRCRPAGGCGWTTASCRWDRTRSGARRTTCGSGRSSATSSLDDCFGDLARGADGLAVARLGDVELWVDGSWRWLQVYTGDDPPERPLPRTGPRESVAVEPMSAPPNAFSSGQDLVVLEPGAELVGRASAYAGSSRAGLSRRAWRWTARRWSRAARGPRAGRGRRRSPGCPSPRRWCRR